MSPSQELREIGAVAALTRSRGEAATCRSCGGRGLEVVLDLGAVPLADGFHRPEAPAPGRHPLELAFCARCALVQILETVPPEELFCRDYPYHSSVSESWLRHCRESALRLIDERGLGPESLVIEPASNDGYMLENFQARGIRVLGVDPAEGPARAAMAKGIPTIQAFFGLELAEQLRARGAVADLVLANNVLAHVPDLHGFLEGVAHVLRDDGVAVFEFPYLVDMVEKVEFDTIYHEHLCYFSLTALERLFPRDGLFIQRVERLESHGGSLRVTAGLSPARDDSVAALLAEEEARGVGEARFYEDFAAASWRSLEALRELLRQRRAEGRKIAAYGAPAKGTVLLNAAGIGPETLAYAVDRCVHKQGKLIPGVGVPIYALSRLREEPPDDLLLLPWNLRAEILAQEAEFRARGGRFIVPRPRLEIV